VPVLPVVAEGQEGPRIPLVPKVHDRSRPRAPSAPGALPARPRMGRSSAEVLGEDGGIPPSGSSPRVRPRRGLGQPVIVSDFDGTLTGNDLGTLVLQRFGLPGWERHDELFDQGLIGIDELIQKQSAMIRARSQEEILRYVAPLSRFRLGMGRLLEECAHRGVDLVVASAGIDFCIRQAFRSNGLEMPKLYCPTTTFTRSGLQVVMPFSSRNLARTGHRPPKDPNFKRAVVDLYQTRGRKVIYIGDGTTDIAPSSIADKVFAIRGSPLERACVQRGIPHSSIRTLQPVARFVQVGPFGG
jgi:2-hydroxy-3-keto-5-methylthiopentenyl-1-phosphate phosphatase